LKTIDEILAAYTHQVRLPWADDVSPAGRVWIVWYDKAMQRRFSGRLSDFEQATKAAHRGWHELNLAPWLGRWIAKHEFFDALCSKPRELRGLLPEIEHELTNHIKAALGKCSSTDVLAIDGCGSLFGITRVSSLLDRVVQYIPGRLLLGFPGKHSAGVYRLLDARDGWNYHATPIPSDSTQ